MSPGEVEGNGFVIGVKPVSSTDSNGSFKDSKKLTSNFDLLITFPYKFEIGISFYRFDL